VYDRPASAATLAREGLTAYSDHPLFGAVGVDRTWYSPVETSVLRRYAAQVPADFRFLVKAHQLCTYLRTPDPENHSPSSEVNPHFLDPEYAVKVVVEPFVEGLGAKGGALLFQFAPQDFSELGGPSAFADALGEFFRRLPKGPNYAVEIRNREMFTQEYGTVLRELSVGHCAVVYPRMPGLDTQIRLIEATNPKFIVARWMLKPSLNFQSAVERYRPFRELRDPDIERRDALAALVRRALAAHVPALVIVNNKAEGCAPESIRALAQAIVTGS
jgi:uncharacterized protein YecE (DUF72 family)